MQNELARLNGIGSVQADGHALDAAVYNFLCDLCRNERTVGRQRHAKALIRPILRELKNISTEEWFAAAEHENGRRYRRDLVDDIACRLRG